MKFFKLAIATFIILNSFAQKNFTQLEELKLIRESETPEKLKNKFYRIPYTIKNGDTFASIIKKLVKLNSVIDGNTRMVKKTIKSNSNITDWDNLPPGEDIFLYVSPIYVDRSKLSLYMKTFNKNETQITKFKAKVQRRINTSIFYMASIGQFTQESPSLGSITFNESSPASVGFATSFFPKKSHFGGSASAYYSYILPAANNINQTEVEVPAEFGGNLYLDYELINRSFNIYGGIDYERFTTFDLETSQTQGLIELNDNSVIYATFGASKFFYFLNRSWFSKLSLSKSLASSLSSDLSNPPEPYDGMKYLLYLNTKVSKKFFAHALLKIHMMSSDDDLTTIRFGMGIGYSL